MAQLRNIVESPKKRDDQAIAAQVGKWLNRWKVAQYFDWSITDGKLQFNIKQEMVGKAEDLDGCYVIRTDVSGMDKEETVAAYRQLAEVERDFRQMRRFRWNCGLSIVGQGACVSLFVGALYPVAYETSFASDVCQ